MFVRDVDIESDEIKQFGFKWLPRSVEDGFEKGLAVCEIMNPSHLLNIA